MSSNMIANKEVEQLKKIVSEVIPSKHHYWVLLSNGTFLVLDERIASKQGDLKKWLTELLRELEGHKLTVFAFLEDVVHLTEYCGWIVTNRYGAYTYVHQSEFSESEPSELAISVRGCFKFMEDCSEKRIVHINTPMEICQKM